MPLSRARRRGWSVLALLAVASGCDALASVAATAGDFGGATANAHCDRRYVTDGGQPSSFCQEVVDTVAASQFADDCRHKFEATPGPGLCPRANIIAGCKLLKKNDDNSLVWDWYYDVSGIIAEAGANAGPDGGPTFQDPPTSVLDVAALCASRARYADGAELVMP
jgi:hypothetical protein